MRDCPGIRSGKALVEVKVSDASPDKVGRSGHDGVDRIAGEKVSAVQAMVRQLIVDAPESLIFAFPLGAVEANPPIGGGRHGKALEKLLCDRIEAADGDDVARERLASDLIHQARSWKERREVTQ